MQRRVITERLKESVAGLGNLDEPIAYPVRYSASPAATSNTAVHAAVTLTAAVQTITTAIINPDVPRALIAKGNASGIAGDVV
ncbi:MAG: hypothetical protein ABII76_12905, partial [Pseudomonadota bacterium]